MLTPFRKVMKMFHPEGIPFPGTVFYNAVSSTHIFQRHYELIAQDLLGYCSQGRVLDIGTGPGWLLIKLHGALSALKITGLDISSAMVNKARNNIEKKGLSGVIDVEEGGAGSLPFEDSSFDLVTSTGSIHHWKNATEGLNETYRVLKPGGYAIMYDLVSDTPKHVIQHASKDFGRLKMFLLWLHAFEEPFYSHKDFHLIAKPTLFAPPQTKFVGVMFCLILKKDDV